MNHSEGVHRKYVTVQIFKIFKRNFDCYQFDMIILFEKASLFDIKRRWNKNLEVFPSKIKMEESIVTKLADLSGKKLC